LTGPDRPRVRLWMKLAALAAVGVVLMHAVHLAIGNRVASRALEEGQVALGRSLARLLARQAADPVLLEDQVSLYELVQAPLAWEGTRVAYCFVVRNGRVMASSFGAGTPADLLRLREPGDVAPMVARTARGRILDLAEPVLDAGLAQVRLGLDLGVVDETRRALAVHLGQLALAVIAGGLAAAFFFGRSIARPVGELLAAADRFDPAAGSSAPVRPRGSDEIAVLTDRFNRMMRRLEAAHAEQLRARQKGIETERLVALGSLVAGVAHEVNNPLAGLKNCVRRLERRDLPEAKRREYLALMEEGLVRIEEVVRELLEFGRPHPPRLEPVPAARLAEESAALVRPLLGQRRARARLLGFLAEGTALADRRLLEQALVNLLLNAAYVTPDGGEIRVRHRRRDGLVGIAVEDDGPGIPPEIRDRILDPFFSTKPEGAGTGLGLSVTRTIVDAHGGDLTFEFPERGGTVATVWIRESPAPVLTGRG
jgi:two-component system, NtrC family, sensor kinase